MISKIKHMGFSVPKRKDIIRDTFVTTAAIACISATILGIDSCIAGIMTLFSGL